MKVNPELFNVEILETHIWSVDSQKDLDVKTSKFKKVDFLKIKENKYGDESYFDALEEKRYVLNRDQILDLSINDIRFKILQKINVSVDITQQLIELAEKPVQIALNSEQGNTYNNKCEVHMPGHMLGMYNDILLLEDCCSDQLQSALNSGWRIIAACPQPDQRRPDYILGRFNPDLKNDGDATRKV